MIRSRCRWLLLAAAVFCCASAAPEPPSKVITRIDLSKPFNLPPGATFTATQGPDVDDPAFENQKDPGRIHLCVRVKASAPCVPTLDTSLNTPADRDESAGIHYLELAEIVYPRGTAAPPLLHLQVASISAVNGSQGHAASILAYRSPENRFERLFEEIFGGNMNQEARYIVSGPLKGAMITVHPTDSAPFGYWVTVHRLTPDDHYKQVLRYRSATRYGDGNRLAVIDSEMPNILHRLGLWRLGQPLPLPHSRCPRPRLVKMALWCS